MKVHRDQALGSLTFLVGNQLLGDRQLFVLQE